ncbi:hypothetical protein JHK86_016489 [Glycine max]|nr:hypothetical protein JHK86_016489 [Glycine max]
MYTYMAICFHWDVLQLSYFFLDLLDLDEEAGMIQKSTNQTDQNENVFTYYFFGFFGIQI